MIQKLFTAETQRTQRNLCALCVSAVKNVEVRHA